MICKKCAHENYCDMAQFGGHVPPITACPIFKEKSQTNADRIRAMTDEGLAEFFAQQEYRKPVFDGWLPLCNHVMGPRTCHENECEECWLGWLKEEGE